MSLQMGTTDEYIIEFSEADLIANVAKYIPLPRTGWVKHLRSMVSKNITTGGTLTLAIAHLVESNPPVTYAAIAGLAQTIANSATVGTEQTTISTLNDATAKCVAGDVLRITPAGFATAGKLALQVSINSATNSP